MIKRSAFTMIELVMVIVVFGIVASIGADIITSLYTNYLRARAINHLQSQTEITLEQIAKRLQYRIKDSVRASNNNGGTWNSLSSVAVVRGFTTVEWIGISNESFLGDWNGTANVPGWSGLIDMDSINTNFGTQTLETPGSRLDFTNNTIKALTNDTVAMDGTPNTNFPALIFKGKKSGTFENYYSPNPTYTNDVSCVANDCAANPTTFSLPNGLANINGNANGDVYEQYYLAHTAYALDLTANANGNGFDLMLHYNYQPWNGENYNAGVTPRAILAENVSTFRIRQEGNVIRIKLCIHDNNQSGNFDFSACKEKVIY